MVRLADRPDMTLDVYRGRKTTMQQQPPCHNPKEVTQLQYKLQFSQKSAIFSELPAFAIFLPLYIPVANIQTEFIRPANSALFIMPWNSYPNEELICNGSFILSMVTNGLLLNRTH